MTFHRLNFRRALNAAFAVLSLVAFPAALRAQSEKAAAGKLGGLDMELQTAMRLGPTAAQYPNSDYARLLDFGNVTVKSDGTTVAEYRETYRLFNERARPLAEVSKSFNASYQSIKIVRARTIRKDGTILEVKPEAIRIAESVDEFLMYSDAKTISFSMPGIEDDCVIDYTWQEITRPLLMPGQFWTYWGFSGEEPVWVSRYTLRFPAEKPIQFKVYNDDKLQPTIAASSDGRAKTYTWERRDLKPIEREFAMPSRREVMVWMEVSSLGSWQEIAKWFWGLQKPQAVATPPIRATVNQLTAGMKTEEEKARAIYDWVANRARYVGLEFGISAYKPHAAAEVHEKLYGDCKDKANLLITMLGLAGIKAHPVLLAAGDRRPIEKGLPTLNAFNHCIALANIGSKEVWLDATAEACAFGDIPDSDRGVEALVVREGAGAFQTIPTYQPEENGRSAVYRVAMQPDGSAKVQAEITSRGADGQLLRGAVRMLPPKEREKAARQIAQQFSTGAQIKEFTLPDGTDKNTPYTMKIAFQAPNYAEPIGSLLAVPLSGEIRGTPPGNPFDETRNWPIVEEDCSLLRGETILTLPEGYVVDSLPAELNLKCPLQEYRRTLVKSADGRTITITETTIERPGRVPASDHGLMKSYYDSLLKSLRDKIVLRKQ